MSKVVVAVVAHTDAIPGWGYFGDDIVKAIESSVRGTLHSYIESVTVVLNEKPNEQSDCPCGWRAPHDMLECEFNPEVKVK